MTRAERPDATIYRAAPEVSVRLAVSGDGRWAVTITTGGVKEISLTVADLPSMDAAIDEALHRVEGQLLHVAPAALAVARKALGG